MNFQEINELHNKGEHDCEISVRIAQGKAKLNKLASS